MAAGVRLQHVGQRGSALHEAWVQEAAVRGYGVRELCQLACIKR